MKIKELMEAFGQSEPDKYTKKGEKKYVARLKKAAYSKDPKDVAEWERISAHYEKNHGKRPSGPQQEMFARQEWNKKNKKKMVEDAAPAEPAAFGDRPRLHVPTFIARQKYPLAKTDAEALMLYMTDKERDDVNKIEQVEKTLSAKIGAVDQKVDQLARSREMKIKDLAVKEDASCGGTSAGAVASVAMPMGSVQKRVKENKKEDAAIKRAQEAGAKSFAAQQKQAQKDKAKDLKSYGSLNKIIPNRAYESKKSTVEPWTSENDLPMDPKKAYSKKPTYDPKKPKDLARYTKDMSKKFTPQWTKKKVEEDSEKELKAYLDKKERVVKGGNALSAGEKKQVAQAKKDLRALRDKKSIDEGKKQDPDWDDGQQGDQYEEKKIRDAEEKENSKGWSAWRKQNGPVDWKKKVDEGVVGTIKKTVKGMVNRGKAIQGAKREIDKMFTTGMKGDKSASRHLRNAERYDDLAAGGSGFGSKLNRKFDKPWPHVEEEMNNEGTMPHVPGGMQRFTDPREFTLAAKENGFNVVNDAHADAENGPSPDDLDVCLFAVDGDSLDDDQYGMFSFVQGEPTEGVLFNDDRDFQRWMHEEEEPVMAESTIEEGAMKEIAMHLEQLTLDEFWQAAANSGYTNERGSGGGGGWHDDEHADKEALHFKGFGKNSDGLEQAYYDMVWWNPDDETMEQSGVVVYLGNDGKLYGEFSGVSEPIMRMRENKMFDRELAAMKRIMNKK